MTQKQTPKSSADKTPVYTIFAFGTEQGSEREDKGEIEKNIISEFSEACPPKDRHVIQGPSYLARTPTLTGIKNEVKEDTDEAIKAIKNWIAEKEIPAGKKIKINMIGFSRGAVTCLRIANAIYNDPDLQDIVECDMLPIDPAAGTIDKADEDARNIPPIVRNYIAPVQLHENDRTHRAQTLGRARAQDPSKTYVEFLPLPGSHNASVLVRGKGFDAPGIVLRHLAYDFLTQAGTDLSYKTEHAQKLRPAESPEGEGKDQEIKRHTSREETKTPEDPRPKSYYTFRPPKGPRKYKKVGMREVEKEAIRFELFKIKEINKKLEEEKDLSEDKNISRILAKLKDAEQKADDYIALIDSHENRTEILDLEFLSDMRLNEERYSLGRKVTRSALTNSRLRDYVEFPDFFYNQIHFQLFKKLYPCAYVHFFRDEHVRLDDLGEELNHLRQYNPKVYTHLFEFRDKHKKTPTSQEESELKVITRDQAIQLATSTHWQLIRDPAKQSELEILSRRIIQEMRRYQSERHWWRDLFGIKNTHHSNADIIVDAIHEINDRKISDDEKLQQIANKLVHLRNTNFKKFTNSKFMQAFNRCLVFATQYYEPAVQSIPREHTKKTTKVRYERFGYLYKEGELGKHVKDLEYEDKCNYTFEGQEIRSEEDFKQMILYYIGVKLNPNQLDIDLNSLFQTGQAHYVYTSFDYLFDLKKPDKKIALHVENELMKMHLTCLYKQEGQAQPEALLRAIKSFLNSRKHHAKLSKRMKDCLNWIDKYFKQELVNNDVKDHVNVREISKPSSEHVLRAIHSLLNATQSKLTFFNKKVEQTTYSVIRHMIEEQGIIPQATFASDQSHTKKQVHLSSQHNRHKGMRSAS